MQAEAKILFRMKRSVNAAARLESPMEILSQKLMIEDHLGMMLRKKEISGRGYGIIDGYIKKKIPKEKYLHSGGETRKMPRPSTSEKLTEKEFDKLVARSNDAF